jgi:hypothetical protein
MLVGSVSQYVCKRAENENEQRMSASCLASLPACQWCCTVPRCDEHQVMSTAGAHAWRPRGVLTEVVVSPRLVWLLAWTHCVGTATVAAGMDSLCGHGNSGCWHGLTVWARQQ